VRTAIGDYGGHLKDVPPTQLAAGVVAEAVKRANIEATVIGHVVFGALSRCRGGRVKSGEEKDEISLSRPSLPGGGDQLCRSLVFPVSVELARH
jgi:hypothetical protein